MRKRNITGIIIAVTLLVSGCGFRDIMPNSAGDAATANESVVESASAITDASSENNEPALPDHFEFNPHVYSPTLAQEIPQESWDAFYNLCVSFFHNGLFVKSNYGSNSMAPKVRRGSCVL